MRYKSIVGLVFGTLISLDIWVATGTACSVGVVHAKTKIDDVFAANIFAFLVGL